MTLHTLRHTCASRLIQGGMDLYRVSKWLGHSTTETTQRYAHLAVDSLDSGLAILDGCATQSRNGSAAAIVTIPEGTV